MITSFKYELWNGKKVVGYRYSIYGFYGKYLIVPELSMLKQPYNRRIKEIKIPIITRLVFNDGVTFTYRMCLDVSRKSKRQIELIKNV